MKILICDDDSFFAAELSRGIEEILAASDYTDRTAPPMIFNSPRDLISYLQCETADLLFLDISMPGIDGFSVARICLDSHPDLLLIFVSGNEQQVFYSMRFSPFRFLRKSTYREELKEALDSAGARILENREFLTLRTASTCTPVMISRILYAEKEKQANYISVHCIADSYRYRTTIRDLERELSGKGFIRVNPGVLINMRYISRIEGDQVILSCGASFTVSRANRNALREQYLKYMRRR